MKHRIWAFFQIVFGMLFAYVHSISFANIISLKVLSSFMVGLHNLYWYYGTQTYLNTSDGVQKLTHSTEAFQG